MSGAFDAAQGPLPLAVLRLWGRTWWVQLLLFAALGVIQLIVILPRFLPWGGAMHLAAGALYLSLLLRAVTPPSDRTWWRVGLRTAGAAAVLAVAAAADWVVMNEIRIAAFPQPGGVLKAALTYVASSAVLAALGPPLARAAWRAAPGTRHTFAWRLAWFALATVLAATCALLLPWLFLAAMRTAGLPLAYSLALIQVALVLGSYTLALPLAAAPVILARAVPPAGA